MFDYFNPTAQELNTPVIHQWENFEVCVDKTPIGGYRGQVGTLTINHVNHTLFTDWSADDLEKLATLIQKILKIQEENQVSNALIFGKQEQENFKLSLIAYPNCNWIEKIMEAIHVVFGSPSLHQAQIDEIGQFYSDQLKTDIIIPPLEDPQEKEKPDPFCKTEIIEKQRITLLTFEGDPAYSYDLLHDNRPKRPSIDDPHLLIIPEGASGHCDGSQVPEKMRFQMLQTMQKAMQIFREEGLQTLIFLERNGEQLQGVQHKHGHMMGIHQFPETFLAKLCALIKLTWSSLLSDDQLTERLEKFQKLEWQ